MKYIGIDLGGTNISAGIIDENMDLICTDSISTGRDRHYRDIIRNMAEISIKLIKDSGFKISDIKSIGIGVPGVPDNSKGMVVYACNIGFRNVPLREEMQKYINLPILIENDANCAALAENLVGAARNAKSSVTVTLGTGIGGGIIIDKRIYRGFNYLAGELGHMVINPEGERCGCGRRGCWETYASGTALIRQTKEAVRKNKDSIIYGMIHGNLDDINAKIPFDAAKMGDKTAQRVIDGYLNYLAVGLVNIINILQPEVTVIGGGISNEGEYLLKPLRDLVYRDVYASAYMPRTRIVAAERGNDAGIIGAAMLGWELEEE